MQINFKHEWIETNVGLMLVLTMLAIGIGGLVGIAPLFFIDKTKRAHDRRGRRDIPPAGPPARFRAFWPMPAAWS